MNNNSTNNEERAMNAINIKAFNKIIEQIQKQNIPEEINKQTIDLNDKENLFNTFLMFQNFLDAQKLTQYQINKNSENVNNNSSINFTSSHNEIPNKENNSLSLDKLSLSTCNEPQKQNNNIISNKDINTEQSKTIPFQTTEPPSSQQITNNDNNNIKVNINNNGINSSRTIDKKNHDDIPIKSIQTNFMDFLEQQLAKDENSQTNNKNDITPKKKIVKTVHNKKVINVSKPSKNDKKYTYYTDHITNKNAQSIDNNSIQKNKHLPPLYNNASPPSERIKTKENENELEDSLPEPKQEETIKSDIDNEALLSENQDVNELPSLDKINKLESEIAKFREEKSKLFKMKSKYDKLYQQLQKDINEFNIQKQEFQIYKDTEMKKIQNEKAKLSKDIKSLSHLQQQNQLLINNSKKDKEQIKLLQQQLTELQNKSNDINNDNNKNNISQQQVINQVKDDNTIESNSDMKNQKTNKFRGMSSNQKIPKSKTSTKFPLNNLVISEQENENEKEKESNNQPPKHKLTHNTNGINSNTYNTIQSKHKKQYNIKNKNYNTNINRKENHKVNISKTPTNHNHNNNNNNQKQKLQPKIQVKPSRTSSNNISSSTNNITKKILNNNKPLTEFPKTKQEAFDFVLPEQHSNPNIYELIKSVTTEGKVINLYTNNKREIIFASGVRKEIFNDNHQVVYFANGDLKQIFPDGKSVYYFHEAKTVQTTYTDGLQVFKFNGNQIEKHYPDGTKEINFPDGSLRYIHNNGYEETHYVDGTVQKVNQEGVITLEHNDGTKEVKFPDGREEFFNAEGEKIEEESDNEMEQTSDNNNE